VYCVVTLSARAREQGRFFVYLFYLLFAESACDSSFFLFFCLMSHVHVMDNVDWGQILKITVGPHLYPDPDGRIVGGRERPPCVLVPPAVLCPPGGFPPCGVVPPCGGRLLPPPGPRVPVPPPAVLWLRRTSEMIMTDVRP